MKGEIFDPENRLAGVVRNPAAPAFEELVERAEQGVVAVHADVQAELDRAVDRVLAHRSSREEDLFADCLSIGAEAVAVAETAAFVGADALGKAAAGLYNMVELLIEKGAWHTGAVMLHLDAIQTLRSTAVDPEVAARTLEQLTQMRTLLAKADAPH